MAQSFLTGGKNRVKSPKKERKEAIGWSTNPLWAWGIRCCFVLYAPVHHLQFGDLATFESQHVRARTCREGGVLMIGQMLRDVLANAHDGRSIRL